MSEGAAEVGGSIVVDRELCLGTGMCLVFAPGTFEHDDDAKAVVADHSGDPAEAIATAVEACPTGALRVVGEEGT